jgi:hypothetical protein
MGLEKKGLDKLDNLWYNLSLFILGLVILGIGILAYLAYLVLLVLLAITSIAKYSLSPPKGAKAQEKENNGEEL